MRQQFTCGDCGLENEVELPQGLEADALTAFRIYKTEHDAQSLGCARGQTRYGLREHGHCRGMAALA